MYNYEQRKIFFKKFCDFEALGHLVASRNCPKILPQIYLDLIFGKILHSIKLKIRNYFHTHFWHPTERTKRLL